MTRWVNRIAIAFGVVVTGLVAAVLLFPVWLDVDAYRAYIVAAAAAHIHGKVEIGSLRLVRSEPLRIEIDGIRIDDARGRRVVNAEHAYFRLPLASWLGGRGRGELVLESPRIDMVRDADGTWNIASLWQGPDPVTTSAPAPEASEPKPASTARPAWPALALRPHWALEIRRAQLHYTDGTRATTAEGDISAVADFTRETAEGHFALRAPGTDVRATAQVTSFRSPQLASSFQIKSLFGGQGTATASIDFRPSAPAYSFRVDLHGVRLTDLAASPLVHTKSPALGTADLQVEGQGSGAEPDAAKTALRAQGTFSLRDAKLADVDVGREIVRALNQALTDLAAKVPAIGKKTIPLPPVSSDAEFISAASDFTIADGVLRAPHFTAKSAPNRSLDLAGAIAIDLRDNGLTADGEAVDTYNITHARDLAVSVHGVRIEHILAADGQPVKIPISVSGKLGSPVIAYGAIAGALTQVALGNLTKAAQDHLGGDLGQRLAEKLKTSPELKDALKNLGKKLGL